MNNPSWIRSRSIIGVMVLIAAVILLLAPSAWALTRLSFRALEVRREVQAVTASLRARKIEEAGMHLHLARQALNDVHEQSKHLGWLREIPWVGLQIRGLEDASAAGTTALEGIEDLSNIAAHVQAAYTEQARLPSLKDVGVSSGTRFQDLSPEQRHIILQRAAELLPQLRLARDKIQLANVLWKRVPEDDLASPIRKQLAPMASELPKLSESLNQLIPLLEILGPLAGKDRAEHLMVVLQNNQELRPSGGFIGSIGTMTVDAGVISDRLFGDVYAIDHPISGVWTDVPPAPIVRYLHVKQWFLRDVNWSPDFPTSAHAMLETYRRERERAGGVPLANPPMNLIAFEPTFFADLLRLTGPITVDGITLDANTFFDRLEYEVEIGFREKGIPENQRKELLVHIGEELMRRLETLPASRWPELLDVIARAREEKHVLLFSEDPALLSQLDANGWTGRVHGAVGDYLMVVDANLAALKTDGVMQKAVAYTLDATDPEQSIATVTLTYTNRTTVTDWRHTRYRSYTRVYVPDGSTLLSSEGAMDEDLNMTGGRFIPGTVDVFHELGKTVFGAFWAIEPGKTGTLTFRYRLPRSVVSGSYDLFWQKQIGADTTRLTLDHNFGKNITSATPPEDASRWGDGRYQLTTDARVDRKIEVKME